MPPFTSPAVTARLSPLLVSHNAQRILISQQQQLTLSRHAVFSRPSSMSAIVRGLRRSFRDPDGKRPPGYNPEVAAHVRQRRQEREAADVPTYKLFRGKKDITERPVAKAKTRRARFFDPEDEYGKKSLVYQAKTGKLEAEVKALARQRRQDGGEQEYDDKKQSFRRDDGGRSARGGRDGQDGRNNRDGDYEPRSRTARTGGSSFGSRDGARSRQSVTGRRDRGSDRRNDRGGYQGGDRESRQPYNRDRAPERRSDTRSEGRFGREQRQDYNVERNYDRDDRRDDDRDGSDNRPREPPASIPVPLSIPYTTAASQFLYGRSVVEAALRSARRQLYKLYVYGGANRSTGGAPQEQHAGRTIERLAKRRGLNVQIVDERWQRLLDKMSKGRPHNGYVLEASPLPQPPLTALGRYTDGTTSMSTTSTGDEVSPFTKGAGFQVEVGYQSREEADVNGTTPFVAVDPATARHHRPLVLLLDQVLDPGNLGAILRSASFLGVSAVAVSKHSSATLTSVALKASAGAAEALALFSVETPATFLAQSRKAGWKVYAAVPPPEGYVPGSPNNNSHFTSTKKPVFDLDGLEAADPLQTEAIILVMGSEGEGLPRAIRREADAEVSIANRSGSKAVDSLNVSVATGLLCASFLKGTTRGVVGSAEDESIAVEADPEEEAESEETAQEEKTEETKVRDELGIF